MDRFDDDRNQRKKVNREDPRDTRRLDITPMEAGEGKPLAKSVQELIDEEMRLESGFKKEKKEATENGKFSETTTLLTMAQREEIFNKKCTLLNKYMRRLNDDFDRYRRSLSKLNAEREEYGKTMYRKGVAQGRTEGAENIRSEVGPRIETLIKKSRKLKFVLVFMFFLEFLTLGVFLGLKI